MQLHLSTWTDVESYLARCRGIVIPIGSTEQHGPNGLLGTDALCPEIIAKEAGDRSGLLIGPTFNIGIAQHHMGFPGTITLRPSTMIAAMNDWIESLTRHGFNRLFFLNGHGGNVATIEAAFGEAYANCSLKGAPAEFACRLRNWWELKGVMKLATSLYPKGHGSHATPSEVAVTQYAYPETIRDVEMTPKIAPTGPIRDADDYRARFPDGRIGSDPSLATPEDGKTLVEASVAALITEAQAFFDEGRPDAGKDSAQAAAE
ncbi:MAG: creatininase family protein [Maricaulaceae bacterium]|jgi:creatinine amidohydrolase/Fe(II)-dependent formamide hydrolase-like protein